MGEGAGRGKKRRKSIPFPLFFTIGGKTSQGCPP
jgi:hypothetical protein